MSRIKILAGPDKRPAQMGVKVRPSTMQVGRSRCELTVARPGDGKLVVVASMRLESN